MMHAQPQLSATPPFNWVGCVCLTPMEAAMVVSYLPRHLAIRRLLQVTAAKAAAKARKLNELPGTL